MGKKLVIVSAVILGLLMAACSAQGDRQLSATEQATVKTYSEPMVDNILTALKNNDYDSFSKNFDPTLRTIMGLTTFADLLNKINARIGTCGSRTINQMSESKGMIEVNYALVCDNNRTVPMLVSFHTEEPHLIGAFSFPPQ